MYLSCMQTLELRGIPSANTFLLLIFTTSIFSRDRGCVERLASILYWRRYPGNDLAEAALPHAALGTHIYTHVQYDAKHGIRAAMVSALEEEFRDFNL